MKNFESFHQCFLKFKKFKIGNFQYFLYLFDTKYPNVNQIGSTTVVLKVRNIAGGEENCLGSGDQAKKNFDVWHGGNFLNDKDLKPHSKLMRHEVNLNF